uniref:Uncharacterized protein n=1 Tax=Solanum tuberosum TaxID=4113 RepID=M1DSG8_SOLTU
MKISESPNPFDESPKGLILAFCSSVLSPEGKDQIGSKKKQSSYHQAALRSRTMSPNDPKHDDVEDTLSIAEGNSGHSAEMNQEVERDFKLTTIVTQLNELATKISEVENQCRSQGRYIPPDERERSMSNENKRIKDKILIILPKLHEQDRMLEVMRESIELLIR